MPLDIYLDTDNPVVFAPTNGSLVSGDVVLARIETLGDVTLTVSEEDNDAIGSTSPTEPIPGLYRYVVLVNDVVAEEGVANVRPTVENA